mgnify:CR=1 FL=1
MKKKLACMLLMGTLALSMAACGNGQDKNTGAATENSVERTEGAAVEMWHRHYRTPKKQWQMR